MYVSYRILFAASLFPFTQSRIPDYSNEREESNDDASSLQNVSDHFFLLLFIGCFSSEVTPIFLGESRGINR